VPIKKKKKEKGNKQKSSSIIHGPLEGASKGKK
jgi:hypothetical protein